MKKGFTLIELLVVVLIIGVLAAVAVPMYQKAVERSIAAKMISSARALKEAQQRYYMANGKYAKTFSDLDINFGNPVSANASHMKSCAKAGSYLPASDDAVRDAGEYEIAIGDLYGNSGYAIAYRKNVCGSIFFILRPVGNVTDTSALYCNSVDYVWERKDFCSKVFGTDPRKDKVTMGMGGWVVKVPSY